MIAILFCLSCKSKSIPKEEKRVVVIELKQRYDQDYIMNNYEVYKPVKIKRSNRTLNQFTSTFSLDDSWYKGLINKLNEDPNVIKIIEINSSKVDQPVNSQNQQRSTSTPIIKKAKK